MVYNIGLEFAGTTDPGLVRSQNEDAIAINPANAFAVLADGMGGYNAGEIASSIATSVTRESLEQSLAVFHAPGAAPLHGRQLQPMIVEAIQKANTAILEAARAEPQYHGMGTTVVVGMFHQDKVIIAHVGDSRAYRFRHGELTQITRDHSLLQEQIDAGLVDPAMARFSQNKNLVTRAVGVGVEMDVEIHEHHVEPGDLYLFCSDGLSDMLPDLEISGILAREQAELETACSTLVQRANDHGGFDNISVILVRVLSTGNESSGLLERILNWVS